MEIEVRAFNWSKEAKFKALVLGTFKYRATGSEIELKGSLASLIFLADIVAYRGAV